MSGGHALVSGRKLANTVAGLRHLDGLQLGTNFESGEFVYPTVDTLIDVLITSVSSQFDMLTSILVLDYAFEDENDVGSCIEEFIELQDVLTQYDMRKVKLYLLTKNGDLYDRIGKSYQGRDVLIYQNTEVFLTDSYHLTTMGNVLKGTMDGSGISPVRESTLTRHERIEQQQKVLEEDAKQVERETLEYEKDIPQSKLNREDYVDSASARAKREQMQKERDNLVRRAERLGLNYYIDDWGDITLYDENENEIEDLDTYEKEARERKRGARKEPEQVRRKSAYELEMERQSEMELEEQQKREGNLFTETPEEELEPTLPTPQNRTKRSSQGGHINQSYPVGSTSSARVIGKEESYKPFKERTGVNTTNVEGNERVENVSTLKVLFEDLLSDGMTLVEEKLHDDSVIIAVSSMKGSGGSGIVSQTAEVYAMLGRKVCIIDLDINGRGQTHYFSNYDQRVRENKGISNALINVIEGGVINKASVSVNSRIDICGISQSVGAIPERYKETIARNLNSTLIDARDFYDIVLIDIPLEDFSLYMGNGFSNVERFLFVTENKEYEIERLFRQYLSDFAESNTMLISDIFNNSSIILNKYDNTSRDDEGYHINKKWLKEKLYDKGAPYDAILVSGEIPYARNFEHQYLTNQRYVWQDSGYMATIKNMLKEAV